MKVVVHALLLVASSWSLGCGKTTTAPKPAPSASVASAEPDAPAESWTPTTPDGSRPCVTSSVIERAKIAAYFDREDESESDKIVAMGESAVVPLVDLTGTGSRHEKLNAAWVLGYFTCREAVVRLHALLAHPDESMRQHAVLAFARSQGRAATPDLARMLSDGDVSVQRLAVGELLRIGDERAIGALRSLRESTTHGWMRERVDLAIAAIHAREAETTAPGATKRRH